MTSLLAMQPSKYLRKEDFPQPTQLQIANIKLESVDANDPTVMKPVMYFHGHAKGIILNNINSQILASMFGDNVEAMIGQIITVYHDPNVMMGTSRIGGIRIQGTSTPAPITQQIQPPAVQPPPVQPATLQHGATVPGAKPIDPAALQPQDVPQTVEQGFPATEAEDKIPGWD